MKGPVFSVIIPCYNQANYLSESLNSVTFQTFGSWEAIVINDGSTDDTEDVARRFVEKDSRIILLNQLNEGLSSARNTGLKAAKGEILAFLDADDLFFPKAFEKVFHYYRNHAVDLIIGGFSYIKSGKVIHTSSFREKRLDPLDLLSHNLAPPVAHFLARSFSKKTGEFDPTLKSCEDWDYWIRVAKMGGEIHTISEVICGYRYLPSSMSRNPISMYKALSEVSKRAFEKDNRLPESSLFNEAKEIDRAEIQKKNLIRTIGILIQQGKPNDAATWYYEESSKWNWLILKKDWSELSSPLSWKYFLGKGEIEDVFKNVVPNLEQFFTLLKYSKAEAKEIIREIIRPQRFRLNHYRYGKWVGGILNRLIR